MKVFLVVYISHFFVFGHALNEHCTTDEDCSRSEKSVCLNNICSCDTLWDYSINQTKCVKYATEYESICYDDAQCIPFLSDGSTCQNNICVCAETYRWYQGKCQKYAVKDESCENDVICLDPNNPLALSCTDNTCQCSEGYYDRGEDCRLMSELDKDCAITMDCFPTYDIFGVPAIYSHCELGKCVENSKSITTSTRNDSQTYSKTVYESYGIAGTAEEDSCPNGVLSNLTREECANCSNTLYFRDASCICQPGFFLYNGDCIAELGMKDERAHHTNNSDCPIKPGKLVDGVCYCKDYWFQDISNRECIKTTLQYTQNCMENDWCKAMGNYAYCNADTEKCECNSQAVLNETSFYCILKDDANLTDICISDLECALYETCVNERCLCSEGFYKDKNEGLCLPKIGYSCEVRDCSHIQHAICSSEEVCKCESDDYVTDGLLCVKPVAKINEECQIEEQCKDIPHSTCTVDSETSENATTRCLCTSGYMEVDGICYVLKYPGSLCSTERDCTVMLGDSFVCRNMLCQCPIDKSLNENSTICVSKSARNRDFSIVLFSLLGFVFTLNR